MKNHLLSGFSSGNPIKAIAKHRSHKKTARKIFQYKTDHPSIKFTVELQKYNTLSLLDILVRKKDNCFETDVYRKPTFTLLGMKFNSTISETYKNNLVHCL